MLNSSVTVKVSVALRVQVAIARWRVTVPGDEYAQDFSKSAEDMIP